jgi:glycosyltransferase involved in cell wall biosynthesis
MHILHIWDQAGVACIFAAYQHQQGHKSKVIITGDQDKYGIIKFYKDYVVWVSEQEFFEKCIEEASQADIIHIHSLINVLFKIRKKFGRSKKIILHYHGTDIRGTRQPMERSTSQSNFAYAIFLKVKRRARRLLRNRRHLKAQRLADAVIVSTPDLLQWVTNSTYLPNPVDIDHFKPCSINEKRKNALTLKTEVTDTPKALDYCKKNNINLDIEVYDRAQSPIMYADMPNFLREYTVYVDIKYVNNIVLQALSKTGLEALACGLKVLNYRLEYLQGLPIEHDPKNVISCLSNIYSEKRSMVYSVSSFFTCILLDFIYLAYASIKSLKS